MFSSIIIKRKGILNNSHMITNKIIQTIHPNTIYKILLQQMISLGTNNNCISSKFSLQQIPKYIDIEGIWDDSDRININNSNILGDFGRFKTISEINIPINIANKSNVSYYSAQLYNIYDRIKFDTTKDLPLTEMIIGENYIKGFIEEKNLGGGQYLETHDNPHYHAPLNSDNKGYIILGKKVNNKIRLSAFIIPYYSGLYTPKNVIHNDANLIGRWLVVYSKSKKFSTVLLRDENDECTKINFI